MNKWIKAGLSLLTKREMEVLVLRSGMSRRKAMTLRRIGEVIGISQERVRQIEGKALRKLRHPKRVKSGFILALFDPTSRESEKYLIKMVFGNKTPRTLNLRNKYLISALKSNLPKQKDIPAVSKYYPWKS